MHAYLVLRVSGVRHVALYFLHLILQGKGAGIGTSNFLCAFWIQVVAVDLFFSIFIWAFFGLIFFFGKNRVIIFWISRSYFLISENIKNRTCLDFERGQWMKNPKTDVINSKTSHPVDHLFHDLMSPSSSYLWTNVRFFFRGNWAFHWI